MIAQTSSKLLQTNEITPKLSTSSSIQVCCVCRKLFEKYLLKFVLIDTKALKSNTQSVRVSPRMERRVEPSAIRSLPDDDDDDEKSIYF